jgi:hypothetical protein
VANNSSQNGASALPIGVWINKRRGEQWLRKSPIVGCIGRSLCLVKRAAFRATDKPIAIGAKNRAEFWPKAERFSEIV